MLALALAALLAAPDPPPAPAAEAPAPSVSPLTVTGRSAAAAGAPTVERFVDKLARPKMRLTPRWQRPVCPHVTGLEPEAERLVRTRLAEMSRLVGAPQAASRCTGNVLVAFTTDPDGLDRELRASQWMFFWEDKYGDFNADQRAFLRSRAPVRWWRMVSLHDNPAQNSESKLKAQVIAEVDRLVIAVDAAEAERRGLTFGQLASYIAMVVLAAPEFGGDYRGADSILTLFDAREDLAATPRKATAWDIGYLKGLFRTDPALLVRQGGAMRDGIARERQAP